MQSIDIAVWLLIVHCVILVVQLYLVLPIFFTIVVLCGLPPWQIPPASWPRVAQELRLHGLVETPPAMCDQGFWVSQKTLYRLHELRPFFFAGMWTPDWLICG